MRTTKIVLAASALLALSACEDMGHLYPVNPQAQMVGEGAVHMTSYGTGRGAMEIVLPRGERVTGNYGPVANGQTFGAIFKAVHGEYSTMPTAADIGTPTTASLVGTRGTGMQCEFYNDDYTGHGFGGCQSSLGGLYKLGY